MFSWELRDFFYFFFNKFLIFYPDFSKFHFPGHVNGVNVIGLSLQGPSVPLAVMKPPNVGPSG